MENRPLLFLDSLQYRGTYGEEDRHSEYKEIHIMIMGRPDALEHHMETFTQSLESRTFLKK